MVTFLKSNHDPTFWDFAEDAVDGDGGLCGEHDGVVGLAHGAVQHALQEPRAIPQSDKEHGLALTPQPVHPTVHLDPRLPVSNQSLFLDTF